jgi:hypothetical protein
MLTGVTGYWMSLIAPGFPFSQDFTLDPLPPGTNVYATISLNDINTWFEADSPDPKFVATAYIVYWTFYQADGTESPPQDGMGFNQNAVTVSNCARIKFSLFGAQVAAIAQINIFTY